MPRCDCWTCWLLGTGGAAEWGFFAREMGRRRGGEAGRQGGGWPVARTLLLRCHCRHRPSRRRRRRWSRRRLQTPASAGRMGRCAARGMKGSVARWEVHGIASPGKPGAPGKMAGGGGGMLPSAVFFSSGEVAERRRVCGEKEGGLWISPCRPWTRSTPSWGMQAAGCPRASFTRGWWLGVPCSGEPGAGEWEGATGAGL